MFFLLMIIIVDVLCSLLFHVSLDLVILMILCLFARVAHHTYIQIHISVCGHYYAILSMYTYTLCVYIVRVYNMLCVPRIPCVC